MNNAESNLAWADSFAAALAAAGLRHVVLAPGARSAPLALAALRRAEIVCHVISDERAAGYFALGIGKADHTPAAVLCTSGTAAANLLPAVMEANLSDVPLLVLTADRPAEAVGWGANQAADQHRLYGSQVRTCHALPLPTAEIDTGYLRTLAARLIDECLAPRPGPVHANLPFREPLLPETIPAPSALPPPVSFHRACLAPPAAAIEALAGHLSGQPGIFVCGEAPYPPAFAPAIAALAARLGAPILAEPLANLRWGGHDLSHVFAHQARFLRQRNLPTPRWIMRFGRFPVSRVLERWLAAQTQAHRILVAPPGGLPDPLWQSDTVLGGDPLPVVTAISQLPLEPQRDWLASWRRLEAGIAPPAPESFFEGTVARHLIDLLPDDTQLFVGNSLAIRAVDAFSGTRAGRLWLYGNRGASGIDGNLATAAGMAAATGRRTVALIGDQALLHDCGSLAVLSRHNVGVVMLDNGGGGIFDQMPFAGHLPADLFRRGWTAPTDIDYGALTAAFGLHYREAETTATFRIALQAALASTESWLVRAVIDRATSLNGFSA